MIRRLPAFVLLLTAPVLAAQGAQRPLPDTARAFAAGDPDSSVTPVLMELRMGELSSTTVQAYRVGTEALLPVARLLTLAEARYHLTPDGVLEASLPPGPRRFLAAVGRDTMSLGDRRVPLERGALLFRDGELYVACHRLGELLGTTIVVDWGELSATVMDVAVLPIGQRVQRDAARAALARRQTDDAPAFQPGDEPTGWHGLALDYSYYAPGAQRLGAGSYEVTAGTDVLGGSLALGARSIGPADAGVMQGVGSWTGVWEDHRWLKQLRVGDGLSTGPRLQELRGVALTNAPFLRSTVVGSSAYIGRVDPGWSVEAYQDGRLIAVDTADGAGHFGFNLPVRYGENPVDFIAYGPLGDVRQFDRTYRVLSDLLPGRRFEYGVSGGACRDPRCRASANLDLRYGLTPRVTVQAGADRFWRDSLADLWHPYAQVTANPSNNWALELAGVGNALARGTVLFEPSLDLQLSAQATLFDTHTAAPIVTVPGQRSAWSLAAFVRPLHRDGLFYFESNLDQINGVTGATTRGRLSASLQLGQTRLMPYVRAERQSIGAGGSAATQSFTGVSAYVLPVPSRGPVLGSTFFRATLESRMSGGSAALNQAAVFASRPLWNGVSLETGVAWQRGTRGPVVQITINTYLSAIRSYTSMNAGPGTPASVSQLVQGSLLWDRAAGGISAAPGPSIARAGVAGRVFEDVNQNGRYDPGEPLLPGVRVIVGTRPVRSDSNGEFRVWDLLPFEPVSVLVDSMSIDSPLLVPAFGMATLVPNPNRFRPLDVPIVAAGVIEGRIWRATAGTREPVGAIPLVLTAVRVTTDTIAPQTSGFETLQRLGFLALYDTVFALLGWALFEYVVED